MSCINFANDIDEGLSATKKYLSSKYFYDDNGSLLFQKIMELPEYYLTRAELNIFQTHSLDILNSIAAKKLNIIELGAGDGIKTIEFLRQLLKAGTDITYFPIDISKEAIDQITSKVKEQLPDLKIEPLIGDYHQVFKGIASSHTKTVVLYLGANIGNYKQPAAVKLLKMLSENLTSSDMLLVGIDLKKSPALIAKAYNDDEGITRDFNLNLLARINRELGGNFNLETFDFYSYYNPDNGEIRSYLVSLKDQNVFIKACDKTYQFEKNELIYTELSKKYDKQQIEDLATNAGFRCVAQFYDNNEYFADCLFEKITIN